MSHLTYLVNAQIKDARLELNGKTISRPTLMVTDGTVQIYACDVDIGVKDPSGNEQVTNLVDDFNTVLYNVPIARAGYELIYADVGAAVRLRKSVSGQYQIVGYSDEMPGTYTRIPVNIQNFTIGLTQNLGLTARALTLEELHTFGGFGTVAFGSIAVYQGSTLLRIQA
jgi:hypothetical protein